jgi:hypothetical protein
MDAYGMENSVCAGKHICLFVAETCQENRTFNCYVCRNYVHPCELRSDTHAWSALMSSFSKVSDVNRTRRCRRPAQVRGLTRVESRDDLLLQKNGSL